MPNKALLADNFYAALQNCRRARRYIFISLKYVGQKNHSIKEIIMKKVVKVAVLAGVLTLTGCASSSPWSGMPFQEANAWKGIGVQAHDARVLRSSGFTPTDTKEWVQAGISSPQKIVQWNQAGFTPRAASKWLAKDFTLDKAISLKKKGLTVE